MVKQITYGVEIEGIFNGAMMDLEAGDYHSGEPIGDMWEVQRDSSIHDNGQFDMETALEFVSNKLNGAVVYDSAMKEFEELIKAQTGQTQLKKSVYFNNSCGCHIHFSYGNKRFFKFVPFSEYSRFRKDFFDKLQAAELREDLKVGIRKQYFRHYAVKLVKSSWKKKALNRYFNRQTEFNFDSEDSGRGLEWRSFNLLSTDSWAEFRTLMTLAKGCVERFVERVKEYNQISNFRVKKPIVEVEIIRLECPSTNVNIETTGSLLMEEIIV